MTLPTNPETMLQKEQRIFREQLRQLGNCILNTAFDLTIKGSQGRNRTLTLLFLALGIFFTLRVHPLTEWGQEFRLLFQNLLNPLFIESAPETLMRFFKFAFGAVLAPQTLRYLPIFVLPFIISLQSAAIYLADIFEINKVEIAREFIRQVTLTGSQSSINIGKGDITDKDKNSPIYLIGGPGRVQVELDTAALFEKPNGQPRVIGPTVSGKATLEGFERFRQAIDLRDQYTESLEVNSRSLDGIPVCATDVRLLFSVRREDDQEPSARNPHPFNKQAIKTLVYKQPSRVIIDGSHPSEPPTTWTETVQELIRSELGTFMSEHRLAEYLVNIGPRADQPANQDSQALPPPLAKEIENMLFNQFTENFTKQSSNHGAQLGWIGTGTWQTPNNIVPEKHLVAWQMNRENINLSSSKELGKLRQITQFNETLQLIKNVPINRFQQNVGKNRRETIQDLLIAYREQLIDTIKLLTNNKRVVPQIIYEAIKHIEITLGIKHWVGIASSTPEAGASEPFTSSDTKDEPSIITGVPSLPPLLPEDKEEEE